MKISPRYDGEAIIVLDGPPGAVGEPMVRQRRRFAQLLEGLSPEQWLVESRCEGWRVRDVVSHLTTTDNFWDHAIRSGLAGEPSRVLEGFDPKATPALLVDSVRETTTEEVLTGYLAANAALCAAIEGLDETGWTTPAETPPGHVAVSALAHHALWDAWVHERDVMTPLGMTPSVHADEVLAALRYACALSPAFVLQHEAGRDGVFSVTTTEPDHGFTVRTDTAVRVTDGASDGPLVTGDAVELLEMFSIRTPWTVRVPDDTMWMFAGLAEVFESGAQATAAGAPDR